jgi:hypothetical protein
MLSYSENKVSGKGTAKKEWGRVEVGREDHVKIARHRGLLEKLEADMGDHRGSYQDPAK